MNINTEFYLWIYEHAIVLNISIFVCFKMNDNFKWFRNKGSGVFLCMHSLKESTYHTFKKQSPRQPSIIALYGLQETAKQFRYVPLLLRQIPRFAWFKHVDV